MEDERISRSLHDLPRHEASPYFTAGVLRRLREKPRQRAASLRRLVLAVGAAAAVVAGAIGVQQLTAERERQQARQETLARLEALEQQKAVLENEIRSLRRLTRDAQGVVYLGSTPSVDVVVDLRQLARRTQASAVRPASLPPQVNTSFQPIGDNRR